MQPLKMKRTARTASVKATSKIFNMFCNTSLNKTNISDKSGSKENKCEDIYEFTFDPLEEPEVNLLEKSLANESGDLHNSMKKFVRRARKNEVRNKKNILKQGK